MSKDKFIRVMSEIDEQLVERYVEVEQKVLYGAKRRAKRKMALTIIAASLAVVLLCSVFAAMSLGGRAPAFIIPTYDGARYSASDIATVFDGPAVDSVKTNAYVKVYAPSLDELGIIPVPEEEYLTTYRKYGAEKMLDPIGFSLDAKGIASRFANVSGKSIGEPDTEFESDRYIGSLYRSECENEDYMLSFVQNSTVFKAFVYPQMQENGEQVNFPPIVLDGMTLSVDQRQSDSEIIDSLSKIKVSLFEIFGTDFSDAKIIRDYGSYNENGVDLMHIYLYNESDNPINPYVLVPRSDYILISFDNVQNFSGDMVSDGVLTNCDVSYIENRVDVKNSYAAEANVKLIPLEVAEQMLYNGYVFGGHSCKLCMAEQEAISFEGYDAVGITYLSGDVDGSLVLPFYTFYKKIGKCKNGNFTYAKTYVPAVEVSGLEEYFDMQEEDHSSSGIYQTFS